MQMKIDGGKFWFLRDHETKQNITIFDNLNDAVKAVKILLRNDVEPDMIELMLVDMSKDKMTITGVTWSQIAAKLVKIEED